jgi:hypothetical protein
LTRISDSCGFSLPLIDFQQDRYILEKSQERRDQDYFHDSQRKHNSVSIDGLPAIPVTS